MNGSIHRGICVSDLAASARFYRETLGFLDYEAKDLIAATDIAMASDMPHARFRTMMLIHPDGLVIELVEFLHPAAIGSRERRSTLEYGLLHLSFFVDDLNASIARILAAGGSVHDHTRVEPAGDGTVLLYCSDPDGVRIELTHAAGVPAGFSHGGICVEDLDMSIGFYRTLGLEPAERYEYDQRSDWLDRITEVKDIQLTAQMMRNRAGDTIELVKVATPASLRTGGRNPRNMFGLSHLAFWVDDTCAVAKALSERGGHFGEPSDARTRAIELFQGVDPDGVRIELRRAVG